MGNPNKKTCCAIGAPDQTSILICIGWSFSGAGSFSPGVRVTRANFPGDVAYHGTALTA